MGRGQSQQARYQENEFSQSSGSMMQDNYSVRQGSSGYTEDNYGGSDFTDDGFDGMQGGVNFSNNFSGTQRGGSYMSSNSPVRGGYNSSGIQKQSVNEQMFHDKKHGKFDSAANQRLIRLAGNYNQADLDIAGGDDEFGGGTNVHLGTTEDQSYGSMQSQYNAYSGGSNTQSTMGSGYGNYGSGTGAGGNSYSAQTVSYPEMYSSQGSSGMYGDNSPKKRRFTEEPVNNFGRQY